MQVPHLKLTGLVLPYAGGPLTEQQRQACTQEVRQAAVLLAAVPSLVMGKEPGSSDGLKRSFTVTAWPGNVELAAAYLRAIEPLGPRLGSVCLGAKWYGDLDKRPLSPSLIAALGWVLRSHTHTLCIYIRGAEKITPALWQQLLSALPLLVVVYLDGVSFSSLHTLVTACAVEGRRMEVQLPAWRVTNQQAAAIASEWVRVVRV